jgi:hypothetical protein
MMDIWNSCDSELSITISSVMAGFGMADRS